MYSAKFAETNKVTVKNSTNNSIFVGTTKDLQNLLKKQNEVVEVDANEQPEKRLQIESRILKPRVNLNYTQDQLEDYMRLCERSSAFHHLDT
jgi:hypothetical protein